ncbi:MAG: GNAT family N-acetyltransferase [Legionella sp.]|nr:GNAT family N-acetyltransferase [Legionella sp.]
MPKQIIIKYEAFSQPASILQEDNNIYHLVIDGGHGTANNDGSPLQLNDRNVDTISHQIKAAEKAGLKFKSITLTSCFSASFVPLFKKILADDGMIFCQTLSSTANANKALTAASKYSNDLTLLNLAILKNKFDNTRELKNNAECFLSDAIYTKADDTLHCFKFNNLDTALARHNHIIDRPDQSKDTKEELNACENYLKKTINVSTKSLDFEALEQAILGVHFRFDIQSMLLTDIDKIEPLDAQIFADQAPINLKAHYNEKYSYLITDTNQNPAPIAAYLFAMPRGNDELLIGNIGVNPDINYRRKGLASKLFKKITEQADKENKTLQLRVLQNNTPAIKLYEKFGFEKTSDTSDGYQWMARKPNAPKVLPTPIDGITPEPTQTNYSFMLKFMAFGIGVTLLLLAAAFFPPFALVASASYATSGACAVGGLASLGFFGHMVHHDNQQNKQASPVI